MDLRGICFLNPPGQLDVAAGCRMALPTTHEESRVPITPPSLPSRTPSRMYRRRPRPCHRRGPDGTTLLLVGLGALFAALALRRQKLRG